MKRILCLLLVLVPVGFVSAQPAPRPQAPPAPIKVEGLVVTPISAEQNEIADFLDIQFWRFKVQSPEGANLLNYRLELRRPQGEPVSLLERDYGVSKNMEVRLGLMPEGESLTTAPTLKLNHKVFNFRADGAIAGSSASRGSYPNPIKELKVVGYSGGDEEARADGSIVLIHFNLEGGQTSDLVLVLAALKAPEPTN